MAYAMEVVRLAHQTFYSKCEYDTFENVNSTGFFHILLQVLKPPAKRVETKDTEQYINSMRHTCD